MRILSPPGINFGADTVGEARITDIFGNEISAAEVGDILYLHAAAWGQVGAPTVQWMGDGVPIPGATVPTFVVRNEDAQTEISAAGVTVFGEAYLTETVTITSDQSDLTLLASTGETITDEFDNALEAA